MVFMQCVYDCPNALSENCQFMIRVLSFDQSYPVSLDQISENNKSCHLTCVYNCHAFCVLNPALIFCVIKTLWLQHSVSSDLDDTGGTCNDIHGSVTDNRSMIYILINHNVHFLCYDLYTRERPSFAKEGTLVEHKTPTSCNAWLDQCKRRLFIAPWNVYIRDKMPTSLPPATAVLGLPGLSEQTLEHGMCSKLLNAMTFIPSKYMVVLPYHVHQLYIEFNVYKYVFLSLFDFYHHVFSIQYKAIMFDICTCAYQWWLQISGRM